MLNSLSTSDIIQIIGIIVSLLTSVTAIIISIVTLRQNSKVIENSTRPYICVYSKTTNFTGFVPFYYLVIKNFGQTGTFITSFDCNCDLSEFLLNPDKIPFEHIVGSFLAPNQNFLFGLNPNVLIQKSNEKLIFTYTYESNGKQYTEASSIIVNNDSEQISPRSSQEETPLKTISYALQDIDEKLL